MKMLSALLSMMMSDLIVKTAKSFGVTTLLTFSFVMPALTVSSLNVAKGLP